MAMQFYNMQAIDLKMALLAGNPIELGNLKIEPYTLREISEYGYSRYADNVKWLCASLDDFINSITDERKKQIILEHKENLKTFDFFIKLGGVELRNRLLECLAMVFKTDDVLVIDGTQVAIDFVKKGIFIEKDGEYTLNTNNANITEDDLTLVHRDNFDDIVQIVKLQNYLEGIEDKDKEKEPKFANEEARKLYEQMQKNKKKVAEIKKRQSENNDEGEIDFVDMISAVSAKSNSINKFNVWDLTLYQFYDEYRRLDVIDEYNFGIQAMLAGAKNINIKHWSSKS